MVEREKHGQLKKGSVLNPKGRPKRKADEDRLAIFHSSVTPEDWVAIIDRAVLDAKRGDPSARKWLSDYLIGVPIQRTEISGKDGDAIKIKVTVKDAGL